MPGPCQVENHPNFPSIAACLVGSAFQYRKGQLLPVAISKSHMRARASNQEKATFTGHCATNLSKACGGGAGFGSSSWLRCGCRCFRFILLVSL